MFGKALLLAGFVLVAFGGWSWLCYKVGALRENNRIIRRGGAGAQGVSLLDEARRIFHELTDSSLIIKAGVTGYDMLTDETTKTIEAWLVSFNRWRMKGKTR